MSDRDLQFFGNPHQICERLCLNSAHDLATVDLKDDLTDAEFHCTHTPFGPITDASGNTVPWLDSLFGIMFRAARNG